MGLQNWLPSQAALSSMACLDVETPSLCRGKFKSVLQLCLQQRRTREQLVEQGIMPPLKTPAGFHEQIRSLERAKTGTFLKHKLCSRPERSELIRMHILQGSDAQAEASVNASRMNLKRARLADDLNEKISRQPGPRELMEKKILPADSDVEGVLNGERVNSFKAQDVYSFDEDNSDTLSPEEKSSKQETPRSSSSSSLRESEETRVTSSSLQLNSQHSPPSSDKTHSSADLAKLISTNDQQGNTQASAPQPKATVGPSVSPGPVLVKQTLPKLPGDKGRSKKSKEPKPWMKKLKYHQYIPPDQKQEVIEMPMDSAYARLLQQQQQFLQLQILSQQQQQQQHNYTGSLPSTINRTETEVQTSCSGGNAASAQYVHGNHKLYHLPANLDEMKVSELKVELKRRSLPVSGTKTDLIDRLRQYAETSNIQTNTAVEMPASQLTPPVSPIATKVSSLGLEDNSMADTRAVSSQKAPQEEFYPEKSYWKDSTHLSEKDCEKDKRLYEKERQIEELMRKLEQEQRLVEELKMKLKVEKRNQQINTSPRLSPLPPAQIKKETCPTSCSSPALPMLVKQEEAADLGHMSPPDQFIISNQTIKQPETLLSVQAGPQILLPASLPTSAFAIQLPANCIKLNNAVSSAPPGLAQTSGQHPQKTKTPAASQQQSSAHTPPPVENQRMNSAAQNLLGTFPGSSCSTGHASKSPSHGQPVLNVHQPSFTNHVSSCKDPPRYEDAVKQTRSMLTAVQSPSAASQQMDDLFDVLMESGEISPFIKQDPPTVGQPIPVTANVTILPVSTVLSRPPPMVHVAHAPAEVAKSSNCCATLSPDPQLDTLFSSAADHQHTLKLIDALRSPMEADFNQGSPPSALTLHMNNMENMDWLDLTLAVPAEGIHSLDMSTSVGVFSPDFVDSPELF